MEENKTEIKKERMSFSKISVMDTANGGCPFKYKLIYVDGNYVSDEGIATAVGTLIHSTEESIFNQIKDSLFGINIDYNFLINNIKTEFKAICEKFPEQAKEVDKSGRLYSQKINDYIKSGIFRLEKFFTENPHIEPVAAEQEFEVEFDDYIFHGYIDRIFYDTISKKYIIEDIKTYNVEIEKKKLTTPLQFVFYSMAVKKMFNVGDDSIECAYDLPFCNLKQSAGTKGFIDRGIKKINDLLTEIKAEHFEPNPSPLCHWCIFCKTYINGQPNEAKNLCPYFCHYTKNNKAFSVENEWAGWQDHKLVLESFIKSQSVPTKKVIELSKFDIDSTFKGRRLMIKR